MLTHRHLSSAPLQKHTTFQVATFKFNLFQNL